MSMNFVRFGNVISQRMQEKYIFFSADLRRFIFSRTLKKNVFSKDGQLDKIEHLFSEADASLCRFGLVSRFQISSNREKASSSADHAELYDKRGDKFWQKG